jgi:hypothetical protein
MTPLRRRRRYWQSVRRQSGANIYARAFWSVVNRGRTGWMSAGVSVCASEVLHPLRASCVFGRGVDQAIWVSRVVRVGGWHAEGPS